jgi:hypothetical protein
VKYTLPFTFTWIEVAVVIAILAILTVLIVPAVIQTRSRISRPVVVTVTTNYWPGTVSRVTIDGHNYLIFNHGVVHDENCPCRK